MLKLYMWTVPSQMGAVEEPKCVLAHRTFAAATRAEPTGKRKNENVNQTVERGQGAPVRALSWRGTTLCCSDLRDLLSPLRSAAQGLLGVTCLAGDGMLQESGSVLMAVEKALVRDRVVVWVTLVLMRDCAVESLEVGGVSVLVSVSSCRGPAAGSRPAQLISHSSSAAYDTIRPIQSA
jgi:hypothetical protein